MQNSKAVACACGALLLAACQTTQTTYHWDNYEPLLYQMYNDPGNANPETQISKLTQDIDTANSKGLRVPPGLHAHLGMMYAMIGDVAQSQAAFSLEKELYPESSVLIDKFLSAANSGVLK